MAGRSRAAIVLVILAGGLIVSSGCLSSVFGPPPAISRPAEVVATQSPESPSAGVRPAEMALVPEDIPAGYSLRDRTVIAYDEVGQLSRDMGWMQGYRVVYYRGNPENDDVTGIRQVIAVYPPESMTRVYAVEKDLLLEEVDGIKKHEIPFPKIGDRSIAVRVTEPEDPHSGAVYSVLFTKKNVCELITMGGTATDYESLKHLAVLASDKVR